MNRILKTCNCFLNPKKFIFTFFLIGYSYGMFGQVESVKLLNDDCFLNNNEKVFVHLDGNDYVAGEVVNYKAYVLNAVTLKPFTKSKILYFELSNYKGQPVLFWHTNIEEGIVIDRIELPDTLTTGMYTMRAYTNWMRNTSPQYFFNKQILIAGISDAGLQQIPITESLYNDIIAYPECGVLIDGVENRIGILVSKAQLKEIQPNAKLIMDNSVIDIFSIPESGMANFALVPEYGKSYKVRVDFQNGMSKSVSLPEVLKFGYAINLEGEDDSNLYFRIITNCSQLLNFSTLRVLFVHKGKIVLDTNVPIENNKGSLIVGRELIPQGILSAFLLGSANNIACQRLVLNTVDNSIGANLKINKENYSIRDKVEMELEMNNILEDEIAFLSVAVREVTPHVGYPACNIADYLHFYSDVYLGINYGNLNTISINDLLLLAKPEDYAWNLTSENVNRTCDYFIEDKGFVLSGQLLDKIAGKPVKNTMILLAVADSITSIDYCKTDSLGYFYFLLKGGQDNKDLMLQTVNDTIDPSNIEWKINSKHEIAKTQSNKLMPLNSDYQEYLAYARKVTLANKIFEEEEFDNIDSNIVNSKNIRRSFYGKPHYSVLLSDYQGLTNFKEVSDNLLPTVKFRKRKDQYSLHLYDPETHFEWEQEALVLLNGLPLSNYSYLEPLGSKKIKRIDVCSSIILYGDLSFFGIVAVYTHGNEIPQKYLDDNVFIYTNNVHNSLNSFIQKDTHGKNEVFAHTPDFRKVLYWNPSIKLKHKQKLNIEFYTCDIKTCYEVNIQGITNNGRPFSKTKIIYTNR